MHIPLLIHQLLPLLYRSAGNSASWTAFLTLLCEGLEARMAAVAASDDQHKLTFMEHAGMDAASQQTYAAQFLGTTPGHQHAVLTRSPIKPGTHAVQEKEEAPSECFHRADVLLGKLPGFSRAGITILRSTQKACFSAEEITFLEELVPHLEGALLLQRQFTSLRQGEGLLDRLSRSFDLAYILLDGSGRPQLISPAAQKLVEHDGGLRLVEGRLHAEVPQENICLYRLLANLCAAHPEASKGPGETTMMVTRPGCKKPLQIALQPLHRDNETSCAVLFLRDPGAQPGSRAVVLRQLYSLLPSEVRLAESLADGLDVKHAALRMHITENSARTLLKTVFRKLEVNSQAGLIRTVLTLPAE